MPTATATYVQRNWIAYGKQAKLRRVARRRYRDACGRFARAPGWWRPRDNRGRFLPLDHLKPGGGPRTEIRNEANITSAYRSWAHLTATATATTTAYQNFNNAQVYADGTYIGEATNINWNTSTVYATSVAIDWGTNTSTTDFSGYTSTLSNYTTFRPPRFAAKMSVTRRAMVEMGAEQAIQLAVEQAKREMDRTFRNEGLEVDFNQGVWRQWIDDGRQDFDVVEVSIEWTPQPRTQEAWATWTSPEAQRLAGDRPMVEDSEARGRRVAEEARRQREAEERVAQARERREAEQAEQAEVRERAMDLMRMVLAPEQVESWERDKSFTVETANGARRYKIKSGRAGNIYLVKDGERDAEAEGRAYLKRYCFHEYHPTERPPVEDNVIAQKLFIEAHEEEFLAAANEF